MNGFGSFNKKVNIKKKGYGQGATNASHYKQLEAEADMAEARKQREQMIQDMYTKQAETHKKDDGDSTAAESKDIDIDQKIIEADIPSAEAIMKENRKKER